MIGEKSQAGAALLTLAAHNIVQNSILNEEGYVAGNLAVTAILLSLGREAGFGREEMGLGPGDARKSLQVGVTALVASAAFVVVAPRLRPIRQHLRDERVPDGSRRELLRRAFVRFPLGTALFEEVGFRGVLPGLLARTERSGDLASAAVFGLWHLIPTHHALEINGICEDRSTLLAGTLLGATLAAVAGYALSLARRNTGNLLAPWLIHSAVSITSYLAVIRARSGLSRE